MFVVVFAHVMLGFEPTMSIDLCSFSSAEDQRPEHARSVPQGCSARKKKKFGLI